ncbi:MAG TPA: Xaa-Pro peptidase family protein [Candidatus Saccharimonadales bacterium]|nr:Xaa-Pro peptidase family protein [Candidatus Saccharimonadales bacterium]
MTRHINSDFFTNNRRRLLESLPDKALVVMAGHREMQRAADASFKFEQDASFYYLTGVVTPDWLLVIDKDSGSDYLVAPDLDPVKLLFDGGLSAEAASRVSGVNSVIEASELVTRLDKYKQRGRTIYCPLTPAHLKTTGFVINPAADKLARNLRRQFGEVHDLTQALSRLRAIKQPAELSAIEEAIAATARAFNHIKDHLDDYDYEYQVEAEMTRLIRASGARGHAYDPIVASGKNACTLHYIDNDQLLAPDQLLLLDVGARSASGYAADISRTYAVQPNSRQRQVYQAVAKAQAECIDLLKPGLKLVDYQRSVDKFMRSAIKSLGLSTFRYRDYFPHAIGHGLGLDVHDPLGGYDSLQPGMVMTVEPGVYIAEESIGVRIEDDILITESGHDNLSAAIKY